MKPDIELCWKCSFLEKVKMRKDDPDRHFFRCRKISLHSTQGFLRLSDRVAISREVFQVPEGCPFMLEQLMSNEAKNSK